VSEIDDAIKAPPNFPTSETLSLILMQKYEKYMKQQN